jgi:hypothetical protein
MAANPTPRSSVAALTFALAALLLLFFILVVSVGLLPAAPTGPTPTFPKGLELPDQLPRVPR